jgi:Kef-type K+ transport system membrane component KefB
MDEKISSQILSFFHKANLSEPGASFTYSCLLGLFFGALTQKIGIHALFGFFIAGIVVGEAKNLKEETKTVITQMFMRFRADFFCKHWLEN